MDGYPVLPSEPDTQQARILDELYSFVGEVWEQEDDITLLGEWTLLWGRRPATAPTSLTVDDTVLGDDAAQSTTGRRADDR